ncbi:hypothetical protein EYR40_010388 [Pleurotus pulmonarius]|nr:hypothetical protein EYR36_010221 [Pleurotus pulmonarius]KAF4588833.1 hypothetical protein EYR40_010388 [Pleurotus pulmonarius]
MGGKTSANAIPSPAIGQKRPISALDSNEEVVGEVGREPPFSAPKVVVLQESRRNRRAAESLRIISVESDSNKKDAAGIERASELPQSRQDPVPTRPVNQELDTHAANPPAPVNANALTFDAAHQQKMKLYESVLNIVEPIIGLKTGEMDDEIRERELGALKPLVDVLTAERVRLNKITKDKTRERSREGAERKLEKHLAGVAVQKRALERLGGASGSRI